MNMLGENIRRAILSEGAISFARFMELALYCPHYGYYDQEKDNLGRAGDFYTNVSVGRLFGELLAFQFAQWFSETTHSNWLTAKTSPVRLVEAGAHDGRLATDILTWLQNHRPAFFDQLEYWIIEPSNRRQLWQKENLGRFGGKAVWFDSLTALPQAGVCGIIFSNELLDAMPMHRLGWDAGKQVWFEWGVTVTENTFVWTRMPNKTAEHENDDVCTGWPVLPTKLSAVLPDGFTTEICPLAENWWRQAARALRHGRLMTVDYGLTAEQLFTPERKEGTLRSYRRHRLESDVLANVGQLDITAHVNFTALQSAGESLGLKTESLCSQAQFLTRIAEQIWNTKGAFDEWTSLHTRQFQTLTHPEHLGRPFQVLLQSR